MHEDSRMPTIPRKQHDPKTLDNSPTTTNAGSLVVLGVRSGVAVRHLLFVHFDRDVRDKRGGQISLHGVRKHGQDHATVRSLLGYVQGDGKGGAAGNASEDPLLTSKVSRSLIGFLSGYGENLCSEVVIQGVLQVIRNEHRSPPLNRVGPCPGRVRPDRSVVGQSALGQTAHDQRSSGRLGDDDLDLRTGGLECFGDSSNGAARAIA
mmetsp:Transcript_57467/g.132473  ORF Transcript_57467/g.132473 Transcript_57467/m.132473 type:complete len:207 (-) Transcript_57467:626-1246(-)